MRENEPGALPFESPEQENARLKDENSRLRRLLDAHGIAIPPLCSPEKLPATDGPPEIPLDREERARKRIAVFRSLFRGARMSMPTDGNVERTRAIRRRRRRTGRPFNAAVQRIVNASIGRRVGFFR